MNNNLNKYINQNRLIKIGKFNSPFSFNGELKFTPFVDEIEELINNKGANFFITLDKNETEIKIESFKKNKDKLILKLLNINTEEDAKKITNSFLSIKRKDINYKIIAEDIIGFEVYNTKKQKIGEVTDYGNYGQNSTMICIKFNNKESIMYKFLEEHFPDDCIFDQNKLILHNI